MSDIVITKELKTVLKNFLSEHKKADLVTTYLFFLEKKFQLEPVLFLKEKTIYQSLKELIKKLEDEGKIWRETEIKIQVGQPSVNENTKKIYICPFTGKVFGDNTHPNPQDAIYEWVSKCPENTERANGLKVKRFFVSEDPEVIRNYIERRKEPVTKTVYSSAITGKLFNTKKAVIEDFKKNQLKPLSLIDVPNQNRFNLEDDLLTFIQDHMDESKISTFVEALNNDGDFKEHLNQWLEG